MLRLAIQSGLMISCIFSACSKKEEAATVILPPQATRIPESLIEHGNTRIDDYYWMKDRTNPQVIHYLEEENQYTEDSLSHTTRLQEKLYYEMLNRIVLDDQSVKAKDGPYYYYSRTLKNEEYPLYCRTKGLEGKEEVYLNGNELAKGKSFLGLESIEMSPDHSKVAYCVDDKGSEVYTICVKDLATQDLYPDAIYPACPDVKWANNNRTIFYVVYDAAKRPFQVYRHLLGSNSEEDSLIYQENDPTFRVTLNKTKDGRYIVINTRSILTSEVHLIDANDPESFPKQFQKRESGVDYAIEHHEGTFLILTNKDGARNFKLMQAKENEEWTDLFPYEQDVTIENFEIFKNHLTLFKREKGNQAISIYNFQTRKMEQVPFSESNFEVTNRPSREYDTIKMRYGFSSLITPHCVFEYDMQQGGADLLKQQIVKNYDPELYQSEKITAFSHDGTPIAISLVYKKEFDRKQPRPMLLTGYGAYGVCYPLFFSQERLSLLDRGVIFGIAHIRGGGRNGPSMV